LTFYWGNNRRFNSWSTYAQNKFGNRLQKISVNAGFSCPNRDGNISYGGCSYCNNEAFSPLYCSKTNTSITEQLNEGIHYTKKRYKKVDKFIAYFQTYSNTYAPIEILKEKYKEALSHPEIIGISIGTRPDCINDENIALLQELKKNHIIFLELGIESCHNKSLKRINRGHTFEQTKKAVEILSSKDIHITGHLILGLPGETREETLKQAGIISKLPINSLKLHQLQIVKGTKIAEEYLKNPKDFNLFELDEFIDFVISFLERLSPEIFIERLCGDVPPRYNLGISWGNLKYDQILSKIENRMEEMRTYQGRLFNPSQ